MKFHKCPLTGFEPLTPSTHDFLNFDEFVVNQLPRSSTRSGGREAIETPSRDYSTLSNVLVCVSISEKRWALIFQ